MMCMNCGKEHEFTRGCYESPTPDTSTPGAVEQWVRQRRTSPTPPEVRFWAKVRKTAGCWFWTGSTTRGYGVFFLSGNNHVGNKRVYAHRYAYELEHGPIPAGMQIDHLCRTPICVRATHMEVVTHAENSLRGHGVARNALKTHCVHGHAFDVANTIRRSNGRRKCRACNLERVKRNYRAKKEAANVLS